MTATALSRRPVFYSGTVNRKSDPLVRGNCGPGRCGPVYDFIDVVIGPDGVPYSSMVDGCTLSCTTGGSTNSGADGILGRLTGGPRLR